MRIEKDHRDIFFEYLRESKTKPSDFIRSFFPRGTSCVIKIVYYTKIVCTESDVYCPIGKKSEPINIIY